MPVVFNWSRSDVPEKENNSGTIISDGYNLSSSNDIAFLNQPTDQNSTDPLLGPLQNNGGPTFTHALLCGSPAIDRGTNFTASATDQRGFPRTAGVATDIGAVEVAVLTYTVSNTSDGGPGSLRQAILAAASIILQAPAARRF